MTARRFLAFVAVLAMTGGWTLMPPGKAPPSVVSITLSPANASIPDNTPAGTLVSTATVLMSDGSPFPGNLVSSNPALFTISALNVVTARQLTATDVGLHSAIISVK